MTNIHDLMGVQRPEMVCFDQYLCNIVFSSTQKKHEHNILFFLKEIIHIFTFKKNQWDLLFKSS